MSTWPGWRPFRLGQQYDWPQAPIPGIIPEEWGLQPVSEAEPAPEAPQVAPAPSPAPTPAPSALPQIPSSMVPSFPQPTIHLPRPRGYATVTSFVPEAIPQEPEEPSEASTILEDTWPLWLLLAAGIVVGVS